MKKVLFLGINKTKTIALAMLGKICQRKQFTKWKWKGFYGHRYELQLQYDYHNSTIAKRLKIDN
jgi:hypothetical protein